MAAPQPSFIDTLADLYFGQIAEELNQKQREIVAAVGHTRKKGQIVLTINYTSEGSGQMSVDADYKTKVPTLPRGKNLYFPTPEDYLVKNDPRQTEIEFKPAAEKVTEFRSVK